MVIRDLENLHPKKERVNSNLSAEEREALEYLKENSYLVIKPSNKGGNIVVQESDDYQNMVLRLPRDKDTYKILESDPTKKFLEELEIILKDAQDRKFISKEEHKVMWNPSPTIPVFYALPKVHKKT